MLQAPACQRNPKQAWKPVSELGFTHWSGPVPWWTPVWEFLHRLEKELWWNPASPLPRLTASSCVCILQRNPHTHGCADVRACASASVCAVCVCVLGVRICLCMCRQVWGTCVQLKSCVFRCGHVCMQVDAWLWAWVCTVHVDMCG